MKATDDFFRLCVTLSSDYIGDIFRLAINLNAVHEELVREKDFRARCAIADHEIRLEQELAKMLKKYESDKSDLEYFLFAFRFLAGTTFEPTMTPAYRILKDEYTNKGGCWNPSNSENG